MPWTYVAINDSGKKSRKFGLHRAFITKGGLKRTLEEPPLVSAANKRSLAEKALRALAQSVSMIYSRGDFKESIVRPVPEKEYRMVRHSWGVGLHSVTVDDGKIVWWSPLPVIQAESEDDIKNVIRKMISGIKENEITPEANIHG